MKGIITSIQRFSLHDGPGIRSTVFFKGCNMHCKWCHNPETFDVKPQILYYSSKCVDCMACTFICDCHRVEDGKMVFDRTNCTNCGQCADGCFSGALEYCGKEYTVDEVLHEVLQDESFYRESKGGVTLSGGEVFLQSDFALELLKALKEKGIATAIESNMSVPFTVIEKLLPYIDLVMCDLKIFDAEKHQKWTGIPNETIKKNIQKVAQFGKPLILRTPVIPGVNDNSEEIKQIAEFATKLPSLLYYELLNFNPLGGGKFDALSISNEFASARPLKDEAMEILKKAAEEVLPAVRIG